MTTSSKQQAISNKQKTGLIKKFTDLLAWQSGHMLVIDIYKITKSFPDEEKFGLTNQLRRSVVSVTSNISEGFSRPSTNDKLHFYSISKGSLTEVQNQILIAKDVGYLPEKKFGGISKRTITTHKLLTGLINSIKKAEASNA